MIDLSGKTILITGASRGIGAATATALDAAGARVVMTYGRSTAQAEAVAERRIESATFASTIGFNVAGL